MASFETKFENKKSTERLGEGVSQACCAESPKHNAHSAHFSAPYH